MRACGVQVSEPFKSTASPPPQKAPESLESVVRKTLTDVRALGLVVVGTAAGLFGGGWAAMAQVRDAGTAAAREETAGLAIEQKALKANVDDMRAEVGDLKAEVRELRKDLRVLFPRLPVMDGGQ